MQTKRLGFAFFFASQATLQVGKAIETAPQVQGKTAWWHAAAALFLLALAALAIWELLPERRTLSAATQQAGAETGLLQPIGELRRLRATFITSSGRILAMEDHKLFASNDGGTTFVRLGALPELDPTWQAQLRDRIGRSKPVRALRGNEGPGNVVQLASGTILVFYDRVYRSADGGRSFEPVYDHEAQGIAGPMPGAQNVAVASDDMVYFGEYKTGARDEPVRILRGSDDGRRWDVAHTFPPGQVFHIHAVQHDRYRDRLWVLTGDRDHESAVLYTDNSFRTLERLGGGSQDWRVVTMMITREALYWGSDNDTRAGADIFRYDLAAGRLDRLQHLGKVAYYSAVLADGSLALSTAYEPDSDYTRAHMPDPSADLWISVDGLKWQLADSLPYEPHTTRSGRPGRAWITFPGGAPAERLLYTPINTSVDDMTTRVARVTRAPGSPARR